MLVSEAELKNNQAVLDEAFPLLGDPGFATLGERATEREKGAAGQAFPPLHRIGQFSKVSCLCVGCCCPCGDRRWGVEEAGKGGTRWVWALGERE